MEKIINIDGREVRLKTNGAFLFKYKAQFHRDAMKDIVSLTKLKEGEETSLGELDMEVFYNFFWTMAKAADPTIAPPEEYFESFEVFPILDILPEVIEMVMRNLQTTKKNRKE